MEVLRLLCHTYDVHISQKSDIEIFHHMYNFHTCQKDDHGGINKICFSYTWKMK